MTLANRYSKEVALTSSTGLLQETSQTDLGGNSNQLAHTTKTPEINNTISKSTQQKHQKRQKHRITGKSFVKSALITLKGKVNEQQSITSSNISSNSDFTTSTIKHIAPLVLPDIPIVSNFDDCLTTFSDATSSLAGTNAFTAGPQVTDHGMDPSTMEPCDQKQQDSLQAQHDILLENELVPPIILPNQPMDLHNSDPEDWVLTDPLAASASETTDNTVTNTNQKPHLSMGFSFNTTTTNPLRNIIVKTGWFSKPNYMIHPSSLVSHNNDKAQHYTMNEKPLVKEKRQSKQYQQRGCNGIDSSNNQYSHGNDDNFQHNHHHSYNNSDPLPIGGVAQKNRYDQDQKSPLLANPYRRSVYNAELSDLSPLVSPDGSVLHGSSLYQRIGLAYNLNSNAMVTRILQGQAMTPPPTTTRQQPYPLADTGYFDYEKTELVSVGDYHNMEQTSTYITQANWNNHDNNNNNNKRVSKALLDNWEGTVTLEDWSTIQDEKALMESPTSTDRPESYTQQTEPPPPDTGTASQQRRLSQRLLDAFRLSSTVPSTRAMVVQPPVIAPSISSSHLHSNDRHFTPPPEYTSNRINTAWESWKLSQSHQEYDSDIHHLKDLQKSLDEIITLSQKDRGEQY